MLRHNQNLARHDRVSPPALDSIAKPAVRQRHFGLLGTREAAATVAPLAYNRPTADRIHVAALELDIAHRWAILAPQGGVVVLGAPLDPSPEGLALFPGEVETREVAFATRGGVAVLPIAVVLRGGAGPNTSPASWLVADAAGAEVNRVCIFA